MTFDFWATSGWILTAGGFALSAFALFVADGAKKAVAKVLQKRDEQIVRDDARELLSALNTAKEAAIARRGQASRAATAGRNLKNDILALRRAQDALAITTLETDKRLEGRCRVAAEQLNKALVEIETNSGRNGWNDAVGVLQGVTPDIDTHQRKLGTKALT